MNATKLLGWSRAAVVAFMLSFGVMSTSQAAVSGTYAGYASCENARPDATNFPFNECVHDYDNGSSQWFWTINDSVGSSSYEAFALRRMLMILGGIFFAFAALRVVFRYHN